MSAKTPDSTIKVGLGDVKLMAYTFSSTTISDGDTFASGLGTKIVGTPWFASSFDPSTQGSAGVNVENSSGTITFRPGEDTETGTLYVLVRDM